MISVRGDDRLKAAVLAMKLANRDLKKKINTATKTTMGPVWTSEVTRRADTEMERRVIAKGARIKPGNPPVAVAATSTRKLSGGFVPADLWPTVEFGTTRRDQYKKYQGRSRKGKPYPVTRRTSRQLPPRSRARVAYAALREVAPRVVSLWVQIIVKTYAEALDGKRV